MITETGRLLIFNSFYFYAEIAMIGGNKCKGYRFALYRCGKRCRHIICLFIRFIKIRHQFGVSVLFCKIGDRTPDQMDTDSFCTYCNY